MASSGVNIATAYISLVPTLQGVQGALVRQMTVVGANSGQEFASSFTRDALGRLHDDRGRFVREGESIGQQMGQGMSAPMNRSGGQSGDSFLGGLKGKAMAGVAGVAVAVGAAFVDAYGEAIEARNAKVMTQAQLGISPEQSEKLGKIAGDLYRQNYGESISGLTGDVATVFSSLKGLGSDKEIERATAKALSFGQAFEVDVTDAVQSVSTLVGSGLVKDSSEAFDLLTASAQKVPAALRENVFEASDEYSQFFRTLGFSGEEAFGALVKGAEKGEFGIDKTGDAIKEFTLLSTDMSDNTVAAYESIGLNATEMTNAILAGGDTSKEAFNKITDGILGIQDPAAQSQAALALFGTPLEDMNVQDIPQFIQGLKGMSGGLGETAGAADKMDATLGSTASGLDTLWRNIKATLVDTITNYVLPAINATVTWLGEKLLPIVQSLAAWLGENLGPILQKVADFFVLVLVPAIQQAWQWFEVNLLPTVQRVGQFFADTFGNILAVLGGFIDFLIGVFTGNWSKAWDGIKQIFGAIWDQIKNIVSFVWETIQGVLSAGWNWIKTNVLDPMGAGLTVLGDFFSGLWTKVQEVWTWISTKITDTWNWLRDWVFAPLGTGIATIGQFFSDLWGTVQNVWTWISTKITEVWNWINANVFAPLILGINTIMTWMSNLWTTVEGIWNKISGFFSNVAKGISDAVTTVKNAIRDISAEIERFLTERIRNWGGTDAGGVLGQFNFGPGGARGMVVPGRDPGRRDNMLMPVRSEEAIMVPEFTHEVGGASGVYVLNRLAEAGRLGEVFGPGMAHGGVVGQKVHDVITRPVLALLERLKNQAMTLGGVSQYGPENYSGNAINTQAAIDFIKRVFGLTDVWGWRPSGSVAGSDHPKGKAIDAMIPNYQSDAGIALGTRLADWFIQNPVNFGTKYVIWRDRINQGGAWSPYSHPGGSNDTLAHRDHVHISLLTGAAVAAGRAVGESLGGGGSGVERWRGLGLQALSAVGAYRGMNLIGNIDRMLNQIRTESGGRPDARNDWDSNARRGDPSIGLLQVIGCVPLTTKILTRRGWLSHDEVVAGDETIGYNPATGRSEWTSVRRVVHFKDRAVRRIGNASWYADVTDEHRWFSDTRCIERVPGDVACECGFVGKSPRGYQVHRNKIHGLSREPMSRTTRGEFVRTADLKDDHRIRVAAQADTAGIQALSLTDVRLLAWISGDGHITRNREGRACQVAIYQSKPQMVTKLRALLADVIHGESSRQRNPRHLRAYRFGLGIEFARDLFKRSEIDETGEVVFVSRLSPEQRAAWLDSMIDAEGHRQVDKKGRDWKEFVRIAQNDGETQDAIKLAVYLEGFHPSVTRFKRYQSHHSPGANIGMCQPHRAVNMFHEPQDLGVMDVWCVETDLGTWTMDQDGRISLTGNSTFRNALRGTPFEYLIGRGQTDPFASMVSSTLYSLNRYGSLERAWRGVAYDTGGWAKPGFTPMVNMLNKPEAVLTPAQSDAYVTHARALEDGFAGRSPGYTFTGDIHVTDPEEFFREAAWQARRARV